MSDTNVKFSEIDRVIHEPARLAILIVLSSCRAADFLFLQNATGLSKGNLSVQLTKLEEAALVRIKKQLVGKKTRTTATLSARGDEQMVRYWKLMDALRQRANSK